MITFSITDEQYDRIKHLLCGEINHRGKVVIFCGHHLGRRTNLLAREVTLQDNIQQAIELAQAKNMDLMVVEPANQYLVNNINEPNNTDLPFDV